MRIATWNINGMNARLDYVLAWLDEAKPDVAALQELKMVDEKFPFAAFRARGYEACVFGQKAWNGVAVLSRAGGEVLQRGLPGEEAFGSRLLTVRVGDLLVTSVYCPNGKSVDHPDYGRKLVWFDSLAAHLSQHHSVTETHVVCGDFNVVPAPIDSWNEAGRAGSIFHTEGERARLRRLCEWGVTDLYRQLEPEEPGFSWWDYRAGSFHNGHGLRIDLLLGTPSVTSALSGTAVERRWRRKVDGLIPSDHAPVWVDLR